MRLKINEYLSTLFTCLTLYLIIYPFIKHLGFNSQAGYDNLLPLYQFTASRNNSIFLYINACEVFLIGGVLYNGIFLPRVYHRPIELSFEVLVSLGGLIILWLCPSRNVGFIVLLVRLGMPFAIRSIFSRPNTALQEHSFLDYGGWLLSGMTLLIFIYQYLGQQILPYVNTTLARNLLITLPIAGVIAAGTRYLPKFLLKAVDVAIIVTVGLLVFKIDYSYFDYSVILGAVNDIKLGKDILANVVISYGFLNIYIIAGLFKLFAVTDFYIALSIIVSIFNLLGYTAIYFFLRRYTKDLWITLTTFFLIFYVDFYYMHIPIHWIPQSTFLRLGSYIPVMLLIFFWPQRSKTKEWLTAASIAFWLFWAAEYGIYMLLALLGMSSCHYIFSQDETKKVWYFRLGKIIVVTIGIGLLLASRIWLKYHHPPIWSDLFYFQRLYSQSGLAMNQLTLGVWVLPYLIYWTAIYICLKFYKSIPNAAAWLFLAFFALEFFLYFIGKGGGYVLGRTVLPVFLLWAAAANYLVHHTNQKFPVYLLLIAGCVFANTAIQKEGREGTSPTQLIQENQQNLKKAAKIPSLVTFLKTESNFQRFQYDLLVIQKLVAFDQPAAILSYNDTLYYIQAKRQSVFKNAFYPHIMSHSDLIGIRDTLLKNNVRYVFIDYSNYRCYANLVTEYLPTVIELLNPYYRQRARLGLLDVYERIQ